MAKNITKPPPRTAPPLAPEPSGARLEIPPWPPGLPADPSKFWTAGADLSSLSELPKLDATPALKRLGPLPFPRSGFPLMGFLATLYEHVVGHLTRQTSLSVKDQGRDQEENEHAKGRDDLGGENG